MKVSRTTTFLIILLPIQYFLVQFLSQRSDWIELYFSTGFFPFISNFFRYLFGWIPFSVGDILGFILLFLLLKNCYQLIRSKFENFVIKLLNFSAYVSVLYFCFYAFWGLNYFRKPLTEKLDLQLSSYTTEQLYKTTDTIISLLNRSHYAITENDSLKVVIPYSRKEIYHLAPKGFAALSETYPEFIYSYSSIKNSLVSFFHTYNGTSGYINPISGEAQVNFLIPKNGVPTTTCHEIAHQIGWAAENDANFIGFLAAIKNKNHYFKYSGYRMAYKYCISELNKRNQVLGNTLKDKVNKGVYKDYEDNYIFWKSYENSMEPYFKKGYNFFLKANKQVNGINSYNYVVDLLVAYFEKTQH